MVVLQMSHFPVLVPMSERSSWDSFGCSCFGGLWVVSVWLFLCGGLFFASAMSCYPLWQTNGVTLSYIDIYVLS